MPAAAVSHTRSELEQVDDAARALVSTSAPIVLAVSGGRDSMVLLHAVAGALRVGGARAPAAVRVATFDHGTGPAATAAASHVARQAKRFGLHVVIGRARTAGTTEAHWRGERWAFLASERPPGAAVATAHTRDDHIETVVLRALRGAGARGLAGLAPVAPGLNRPFMGISRSTIAAYAQHHGVAFIQDPSNESRRHLRNRVRLDLLPAVRALRPTFEAEMLDLAERAAVLRAEVDRFVDQRLRPKTTTGLLRVAREELTTYDSAALCVLWPAIAARAGVTLDRRGTLRLAQFTTSGAPGARIQLSGRVEVYRHRDASGDGFIFHRGGSRPSAGGLVRLAGFVEFGPWRFRPLNDGGQTTSPPHDTSETSDPLGIVRSTNDPWAAELPADRTLTVRAWLPGDRMRVSRLEPARRVKRFFGDARIPAARREGWPVVLADDEIVWIPGVRRARAAPERSGRPTVQYICERFDGGLAYS